MANQTLNTKQHKSPFSLKFQADKTVAEITKIKKKILLKPFYEGFSARAKFQLLEKKYFSLQFHILTILANILAAESFD